MSRPKTIVVGSRASALALKQTREVIDLLRQRCPGVEFRITEVRTQGDRDQEAPLTAMGKGIFVKELESALLSREIDMAVHSLKDMPVEAVPGLTIAAIARREDPRDALVSKWSCPLAMLPAEARVGTGSPRRVAQVRAFRRDLLLVPIRGNVDTRVRKASTELDGVILAAAGLRRLGLEGHISEYLSPDVCLPAVGQGALAIETRADDPETIEVVSTADHAPTRRAVTAERAFLERLGGGCKAAIAAYGELQGPVLRLRGMVASEDGGRILKAELSDSAAEPEALGRSLAERLLSMGAGELLSEAEA